MKHLTEHHKRLKARVQADHFTMVDISPAIREEYKARREHVPCERNNALREALKRNKPTHWVVYTNIAYVIIALAIVSMLVYCYTHKIGY